MKVLITLLLAFLSTTLPAQKNISDINSHIDNDGNKLKIQISAKTDKRVINYKNEFDIKGMSQQQVYNIVDHIRDSLGLPKENNSVKGIAQSTPVSIINSLSDKDLHEIAEKFNTQQVEQFNKGNLLGVAQFYSDDAMIYHPGRIYQGREAINKYWTDIKGGKSWTLTIKEVGGSRNSLWVAGVSELTVVENNIDRTFASNYIVIMQPDKNGNYKIYKDIYNQAPAKK